MDHFYLATLVVAFISSVLSGLAGGGGGFIMMPYWLIAGLSPAQGAATGAFMATGMSISSVAAFRNTKHVPKNRTLVIVLSVVVLAASIIGATVLPHVDTHAFRYILAALTVAALPLLFVKPRRHAQTPRHKAIGLSLCIVLLIASSVITSSAFSILFGLALMAFYGMSVLEMTALRRILMVIQSVVLLVVFAAQGYLIWQHALAGFVGGSIGSYIGTKYAIKKGERFAKYALASLSVVGAVALVVS